MNLVNTSLKNYSPIGKKYRSMLKDREPYENKMLTEFSVQIKVASKTKSNEQHICKHKRNFK